MIVKKNENIVVRKVYEVVFLIDTTEKYSDNKCHLYELNDIGKYIWDKIDNHRTRYDLAVEVRTAIVDDIPFEEIMSDTNSFVDQLVDNGFVIEE